MDGKDPFGYNAEQYAWVLLIACLAGLVKHLNTMNQLRFGRLCIDVVTAGFTGVMMFWFCEAMGVKGTWAALMIATGGLMGNRAWAELENFLRSRFLGARPAQEPVIPPVVNTDPPAQNSEGNQ